MGAVLNKGSQAIFMLSVLNRAGFSARFNHGGEQILFREAAVLGREIGNSEIHCAGLNGLRLRLGHVVEGALPD